MNKQYHILNGDSVFLRGCHIHFWYPFKVKKDHYVCMCKSDVEVNILLSL